MILITGAGGFIGRNLSTCLHKKGEPVLAAGRREKDDFFSERGIPYVKLDISRRDDYSSLAEFDVRKIVHLAAITPTEEKIHSSDEYISINGKGIQHLLDYCIENDVEKFVNISSLSVYGKSGQNGVKEDANLRPFGAYADYAIAKILAELFTERYAIDFNLNALTLRLGYVFGDFIKGHLLLPRLLKKALDGEEIVIKGTGEYIFDVVYIDDCISAIEAALNTSHAGIYNVGSGAPVSLNQIVGAIDDYTHRLMKKHAPQRHVDSTDNKPGYVMSLEKSGRLLGYHPKYKGIEVIRRVISDYHEIRNRNGTI